MATVNPADLSEFSAQEVTATGQLDDAIGAALQKFVKACPMEGIGSLHRVELPIVSLLNGIAALGATLPQSMRETLLDQHVVQCKALMNRKAGSMGSMITAIAEEHGHKDAMAYLDILMAVQAEVEKEISNG